MSGDKKTIEEVPMRTGEVTAPALPATERERIRGEAYAMLEKAYGGLSVAELKVFFIVFPEAMLVRVCTVLAGLADESRENAREEALRNVVGDGLG